MEIRKNVNLARMHAEDMAQAEQMAALKTLVQAVDLTDEQALAVKSFYPEWETGVAYGVGDRALFDGALYKCLQGHTSRADLAPRAAVSLWAEVLAGQDGTEVGEWEQPESTNPYMKGDRVIHNGKTWECSIDNNVWEPGVYGWAEV